MKFKSITISNFRQFKGVHCIEFTQDKAKNVTVILADNNLGKTTILQAFQWCLYGKIRLKNPNFLVNFQDFKAAEVGKIFEVSVRIDLVKNSDSYSVTRTQKFTKGNSPAPIAISNVNDNVKVICVKETGIAQDLGIKEIERIFPEELSRYFFFDGERMIHLGDGSTEGKQDVSTAVKGIFNLDAMERTVYLLDNVSKKYSKLLRAGNNDKKALDEMNQQISLREAKMKEYEKANSNNNEKLDKCRMHIFEIEQFLRANDHVREYQIRRDQVESNLKDVESSIENIQRDIFNNFIKKSYRLMLYKSKDDVVQFLQSNEKLDEKVIDGITGFAISQILERGYCICGEKVCQNDDHYTKLSELKRFLPPASLSVLLKKTLRSFEQMENSRKEDIDELQSKIQTYFALVGRKEKLIDEKIDIHNKIKNAGADLSQEEIATKERNLKASKRLEADLMAAIKQNKDYYDKSKEMVDQLTEKKKMLAQCYSENDAILRKLSVTQEVKKKLETEFANLELKVREQLLNAVQKLMDQMLESKKKVSINSKYEFMILDAHGNDVMGEGYKVVTSFSYIGGIISIAKEFMKEFNTQDTFPLVMDAPYATLDNKNRQSVNRVIPTIADQMILFTTDSQYNGSVKDELSMRVGRVYKLSGRSNDKISTSGANNDGDTVIREISNELHY